MIDAKEVAEAFIISGAVIEAVRHQDACALEELVAKLIERVREATTAAERERCARIAEQTCRLHPLFADEVLQKGIAMAIRNPETPCIREESRE